MYTFLYFFTLKKCFVFLKLVLNKTQEGKATDRSSEQIRSQQG